MSDLRVDTEVGLVGHSISSSGLFLTQRAFGVFVSKLVNGLLVSTYLNDKLSLFWVVAVQAIEETYLKTDNDLWSVTPVW